jgi:hypothetical protein
LIGNKAFPTSEHKIVEALMAVKAKEKHAGTVRE